MGGVHVCRTEHARVWQLVFFCSCNVMWTTTTTKKKIRFQQNREELRCEGSLVLPRVPSSDSLVDVKLHRQGSHLNTLVTVLLLPSALCEQLNRERKQRLLLLQAAARPWLVLMKTCGKCLRRWKECVCISCVCVCVCVELGLGRGRWRPAESRGRAHVKPL